MSMSVEWGRKQERLTAVLFPGLFSSSSLGRGHCAGEPKKIRLQLFCLRASNRIPIPRLLSLSILVSNTVNFPLQSRDSEFFDNPGQSLIQSAKYLLSWLRIGRYLQCPPRKEPLDIRFATSPTRPSYSQLRTFRQGCQVP